MIRRIFIALLLAALPLAAQSVSEIVSLTREGKIDEARKVLSRLDKGSSQKNLFLHGLLSTSGDSAAYYYQALLRTDPNNPYSDLALFRLAQLQYAQGLYRQAQRRFSGLIQQYPQSTLHARCSYWLSLCYSSMGVADSALLFLNKVRDEYPQSDIVDFAREDLERIRNGNTAPPEPKEPAHTVRYSVQVGAFTRQSNALLRKSFFEGKGYEVSLRTKDKDGILFYLVWVGFFQTREEARHFGEQLQRKYDVQFTLVSEEGP